MAKTWAVARPPADAEATANKPVRAGARDEGRGFSPGFSIHLFLAALAAASPVRRGP